MADMDIIEGEKVVPQATSYVQFNSSNMEILAGQKLLVIINPTSYEGGAVVYDKDVPIGKKFTGRVAINGELETV